MRWVATADVAVAIQRAIEREVTGWFALPGAPLTGLELADALGSALGRYVPADDCASDARRSLAPALGDHAADGTAAVVEMLAGSPAAPEPDGRPAHEALGWAPRTATWAREVYALARAA